LRVRVETEKASFPMARIKNQAWSYNAGERGANWVRAYEKAKGGIIMLEWMEMPQDAQGQPLRDPETGKPLRIKTRQSLGHRDRDKAEEAAKKKARELLSGSPTARVTSLRQLFDRYLKEVTPSKNETRQAGNARSARVFLAYLQDRANAGEKERGPERHPSTLDKQDWNGFVAVRSAGKITGWKRACRNGQIRDDLKFIVAVLNWASAADETAPHFLLLNPWRGERRRAQKMLMPKEKDPRRPGMSDEQHDALMRHSPNWRFALVAVLCRETLHRANSVRQLRKEDVDRRRGRITWPGEYDKAGRRLVTPLTPEAMQALDSVPTPSVLSPWLIPSEQDPGKAVSRAVLNGWMQKAKKAAGIEEERVGFHAYKRAGVRTPAFGQFRDKLREHLTGTTAATLRDVYDDVSYEELAEAMEMLRKSRRRA
jgi:integrase